MRAINFSELQLVQNDMVRIYPKSRQETIQGTFLLKSDLTIYCRTNVGLAEIPLKDIERIVIVEQYHKNEFAL